MEILKHGKKNNVFEFDMYVFPYVFEKNKHLGKAEKSWLE